jgi:hypothetical protein
MATDLKLKLVISIYIFLFQGKTTKLFNLIRYVNVERKAAVFGEYCMYEQMSGSVKSHFILTFIIFIKLRSLSLNVITSYQSLSNFSHCHPLVLNMINQTLVFLKN